MFSSYSNGIMKVKDKEGRWNNDMDNSIKCFEIWIYIHRI